MLTFTVFTIYNQPVIEESEVQNNLHARLQQRIDALGYDFESFTLDHFVAWIADQRRRPVHVYEVDFAGDLFGFWCPIATADYIFIKQQLHPTHRIHVILHELAHIVLDHQGVDLAEVLPPHLLEGLDNAATQIVLRAPASYPASSTEEMEAEYFVTLVQRRLLQLNRLRELYGDGTSISALRPYAQGFDFNG